MGLLDAVRGTRNHADAGLMPALDAARDPNRRAGTIDQFIAGLVEVGIDGAGPIPSADEAAAHARAEAGDPEAAIRAIVRNATIGGAAGGFVTGLGGFVTMPVALPVNLAEFYLQATRMVATIASVRGYNLSTPEVRTAILLTLTGSEANDVLAQAGLVAGGGRLTRFVLGRLPASALMLVNKAIGFRLLRGAGEHLITRMGRAVPLVGGAVGAGIDGWMMHRIAEDALREFPGVALNGHRP
ncbi:MAG: hypothetical protein ACK5PP_17815 [Acidimicrobiales bacterium]